MCCFGSGRCKVAGVARRSCEETKALIEKDGGEFIEVIADLGSTEPIQGIIDKTVERFGKVDILVNNAGIIRRVPMHEMDAADFRRVIDIDLNAPFIVAKAVLPAMMEKRAGKSSTSAQ